MAISAIDEFITRRYATVVPGPRSWIRSTLNTLQDFGLDIVSCRSTALRCRQEFDAKDHESDGEFRAVERILAAIAMTSTEPAVVRLADAGLAHQRRGIALDDQERTPLGRERGLFDQVCEIGRQIVGLVERLPGMRRAGGGRGRRP